MIVRQAVLVLWCVLPRVVLGQSSDAAGSSTRMYDYLITCLEGLYRRRITSQPQIYSQLVPRRS